MQCITGCCSAFQCFAVFYNGDRLIHVNMTHELPVRCVLQSVAVWCSVLQGVAVRFSVLQCFIMEIASSTSIWLTNCLSGVCCSVLLHIAACRSVLEFRSSHLYQYDSRTACQVCVAVYCCVLQCVANVRMEIVSSILIWLTNCPSDIRCSVLQRVAECWSVLKWKSSHLYQYDLRTACQICVVVYCNVLQRVAVYRSVLQCVSMFGSVLQWKSPHPCQYDSRTAVSYVLQCIAACCSVLQCVKMEREREKERERHIYI